MSYEHGIVFSNTEVTSTSGTGGVVSLNTHTSCIHFYNKDNNTDAVVKLNGGPHQVVIPSKQHHPAYVEIEGDYTKFQIMTADVTLAVYAVA